MGARSFAASLALACAALLSGCFAVADLERFEFDNSAACSATAADTRDYNYLVRDLFVPHEGQYFEMKVTNETTGEVVAAIVYDGITDERVVQGTLADVLTPGPPESPAAYKTRFWADRTNNRDFEPSEDHAWNEVVPDNGCFTFDHGAPFDAVITPTDDPAQGNIVVQLTELGSEAGQALIVRARRVSAGGSGPEVGFYRLDPIPETTTDLRATLNLYDVAQNDGSYAITAFVDRGPPAVTREKNGIQDADEPSFAPLPQPADPNAMFELDLSAR